jgi:hypothetical protein
METKGNLLWEVTRGGKEKCLKQKEQKGKE